MSEQQEIKPDVEAADPELDSLRETLDSMQFATEADEFAEPEVQVEKPEEKEDPPPPAVEEPEKTGEEEEDDDDDPGEEVNWKKFRALFKKTKAELKELKTELEEKGAAESPAATAESKEVTPTGAFSILVKAKYGEFEGGAEKNASLATSVKELISTFTPKELMEVKKSIREGVYGDYADEVTKWVESAIVESTANAYVNNEDRQEQEKRSADYLRGVESSFQKATSEVPDLADPKSDIRKEFDKWFDENVVKVENGQVVSEGDYKPLLADVNWPEKLVPIFLRQKIVDSHGGVTKVNELLGKAKRSNQVTTTPISSSGVNRTAVVPSGEDKDPEIEELRQKLSSMPIN